MLAIRSEAVHPYRGPGGAPAELPGPPLGMSPPVGAPEGPPGPGAAPPGAASPCGPGGGGAFFSCSVCCGAHPRLNTTIAARIRKSVTLRIVNLCFVRIVVPQEEAGEGH